MTPQQRAVVSLLFVFMPQPRTGCKTAPQRHRHGTAMALQWHRNGTATTAQ